MPIEPLVRRAKVSVCATAIVVAAIAASLCAPLGAATVTPARYRAIVNAICRMENPKLLKYEAQVAHAQKANDVKGYWIAFGRFIGTIDGSYQVIRKLPVPAPLRQQIQPTMPLFTQHHAAFERVPKAMTAEDLNGAEAIYQNNMPLLERKILVHWWAAGIHDCG